MFDATAGGGMPCRSQIQPFGSPPFLDADHHGFAIALGRIASLPRKHGQAVIAFVVFWFELPWPERAKLAKVAKPDMTDEEVARLSGVSRCDLIRDDSYKSLKPTEKSKPLPSSDDRVRKPPPPAGSREEAMETARIVGFVGGLGSLIQREE